MISQLLWVLKGLALGATENLCLNTTLIELLALKTTKTRHDFYFNTIPSRFSPDERSYYQGLIMEGWWGGLLSISTIILLVLVLYLRFQYGYFGGKKLKNTEYTIYVRWAPGLIFIVSFLLFFISGINLLIQSQKITNKSESLGKITIENTKTALNQISTTYDYLISINMQHATDDLYLKTAVLKGPLEEIKDSYKRARYFGKDIRNLDNRRVISTLVVFCLGFILYGIGLIGFFLKIESIGYALAISMAILGALDCLIAIPYVMQRVASTDLCEQILECTQDNSLPVYGYEIGYYFSDLSKVTKDNLDFSIKDINKQFQKAINKVSEHQGFPVSSYKDIKEPDNDLYSIVWTNSLAVLEKSNSNLAQLKSGHFIKSLCKDIEKSICGNVFSSFVLAEFTVFILWVSLLLGFCSGLLAPRVFVRWRQEDEQDTLAKHNLYQIKQ
jgi:hypothetical protein